jgi:hypothetical protein
VRLRDAAYVGQTRVVIGSIEFVTETMQLDTFTLPPVGMLPETKEVRMIYFVETVPDLPMSALFLVKRQPSTIIPYPSV